VTNLAAELVEPVPASQPPRRATPPPLPVVAIEDPDAPPPSKRMYRGRPVGDD